MKKIGLCATLACILALLSLPVAAAPPEAAGSPAACGMPSASPATGGQPPLFASTCTNCTACDDDSQCGTGDCVPYIQAVIVCEGEEVCYDTLPSPVCSLSCAPCTSSAQCPSGESCVPVRQAFCIPEPIEICDIVLPKKVCQCL